MLLSQFVIKQQGLSLTDLLRLLCFNYDEVDAARIFLRALLRPIQTRRVGLLMRRQVTAENCADWQAVARVPRLFYRNSDGLIELAVDIIQSAKIVCAESDKICVIFDRILSRP